MTPLAIKDLIAKHQPGNALEQEFYLSSEVFEKDVENIVLKSWVLVGHQSQISEVGEFFLSRIAGESVIVVRSDEQTINALINVCRHRGSRVCLQQQGRASRFVCPYHAWTYDLDGNLQGAPRVMETLDTSKYPLKRARLENFQGMLFINFDPDADFAPIADELGDALAPYDLANARIAHRQSYEIEANWKLAVENFCECYHCLPAHREYSVAHGLARPEKVDAALLAEVLGRAESCGLSNKVFDVSFDNTEAVGSDRYFDRYPLLKGHVTGSRDGKPVAPLLGSIKDYDGGASDFQIGAFSYGLAYCDHVVLYRFIPMSKGMTECEVIWLVRADAEEGKDYKLDDLVWLWDVTTVADKRIIQDNSRGVESRFYEPGPFTPMEYYTEQFTKWYLKILEA
jgi:phenylpropionate dioxygenase-like ring-hydroxylating dioxygenase large terminal subunit